MKRYNKNNHNLCPLQKGDTVAIQNQINCQWNITSKVITALPDHQYWNRIDGLGRITLKNCHFLGKVEFQTMSTHIPSALVKSSDCVSNVPVTHPNSPISASNNVHAEIKHATRGIYKSSCHHNPHHMPSRILQALSRQLLNNIVSSKELSALCRALPTCEGGAM